jgi:hypothetical protein
VNNKKQYKTINMTKQKLMYFTLVLFFLYACKKDKIEIYENTINPTSYVLTKQTFITSTGSNGQWYNYIYNEENLIKEIQRIQWGTYTVNGGELQRWQDTSYQFFVYSNNLPIKCIIEEGPNTWYYEYEYTNGLITKKTFYSSDNSVDGYGIYKYDEYNRLIEALDSTDKVNYKHTFDYCGNNVCTYTIYNLWDSPQKKSKYEYIDYDDMVYFARTINGLPIVEHYIMRSCVSENNVLSEEHYTYIDIDLDFENPDIYNYTIEYNKEGLPIKIELAGSSHIYEYKKFR